MRILCCYLVIILIVLQSVNAIAAISISQNDAQQNSHLTAHQNSHSNSHQDSDHHSAAELLAFQIQALDGKSVHSDADHPDCHTNHCHHSNLLYLDFSSPVYLSKTIDKQVSNKTVLFNSLPLSPDSRPPIV
ncbi:hypothetical protein CMT41_18015 [Colwellia sp. MT41]|uniref:DUF2946 domain-containing protein n=1 Tax=Colwellia marinimaniae TaxID=1513592 RepID=A0ABQ0MT68_9GAMM|nr:MULTISPECIES: hypothetical protein [Colwellia]ALO36426.1 hypothetical protein CMT41_18015 [Colwellia sp. MT41]GAW95558.1 hypothetical protein MTCD1_01161 [Colwellia marinimaniae]